MTSSDGINWTNLGQTPALYSITYADSQFVAVGFEGTILTSPDGVSWTSHTSGTGNDLSGIAYGNNIFVAVGANGTILQSGPIITLALTPSPGTGLLTLALTGPTGLAYTVQSSTDLVSWQTVTNLTSVQSTNVIFGARPAGAERVFYRAYSQ